MPNSLSCLQGRRPPSQTRGTTHLTLLHTLAPGIAVPTPHWVEVQGAILHPPAQMQTQGPEQPQVNTEAAAGDRGVKNNV